MKEKLETIIAMLREIDLEKNDKETIRYVLDEIADMLANMVDN